MAAKKTKGAKKAKPDGERLDDPQAILRIVLNALREIEELCAVVAVASGQCGEPALAADRIDGHIRMLRGLSSDLPAKPPDGPYGNAHRDYSAAYRGMVIRRCAEIPWSVLGQYGTDNLAPVAAGRLRNYSAVAVTAQLARWWLDLGPKSQPNTDEGILAIAAEMAAEIRQWHHIPALRVQAHQECYRYSLLLKPPKSIAEASPGLPPLRPQHEAVLKALRPAGSYGAVLRDIKVLGLRGKTLQRSLDLLRRHGRVELVDGTRRWRVMGQ